MNREETLRRYRQLRAINKQQQTDALDCVSQTTMLDCARRLGLARGRTLVLDDFDEMTLVFDLVVHAGIGGRTRAIDRYAAKARPTAGGDDELMLTAARNAKFAVWKVERRHEIAGLHIVDVVTGDALWLIDEALEATCRNGQMCASRLMAIEDFVMTCGAFVPVDASVFLEAQRSMPRWSPTSRTELVQDSRFAIGIYRAAVRTGTTERMRYRDPGETNLLEDMRT
jgi:hypothetical protein